MKTRSTAHRGHGRSGGQTHVLQGLGDRLLGGGIGEVGRVGHAAADVDDLARIGSPSDLRPHVGRVEDRHPVVSSLGITRQSTPTLHGGVEVGRCILPAPQIGEGGFVGGDQPGPAPASIVMLQTVMRPSMLSARIASPVYSMQ